MAFEGSMNNAELTPSLVESLQSDFKNLSSESKKKYPQVKEVNKLRNAIVSSLKS